MDLMAAIAKIEAHLAQDPNDGRGYEVLAPVYLRLGRMTTPVKASEAALRLLAKRPNGRPVMAKLWWPRRAAR